MAKYERYYERAEGITLNKKELRYLRLNNNFVIHPVHVDDVLLDFLQSYSQDGMRKPCELYSKICKNFKSSNIRSKPNLR